MRKFTGEGLMLCLRVNENANYQQNHDKAFAQATWVKQIGVLKMVQGGKEAFISRMAIRDGFKRHGAHGISPALVDIVVERFRQILDSWCEEALVNMHKRRLKVVRAFDLQDYWDEEKRKLDLLKSVRCRFCDEPLKLEDVCNKCYMDKTAKLYNAYDEVLGKASNQMNQRLFLKMTSAFLNIRRQEMEVPKLKALTGR